MAFDRHVVAGPDLLADDHRLLEAGTARVGVDAERVELRLEVAGAHPDGHPTIAEVIERGDLVGGHERVAIRRQQHVRQQPHARRDRCAEAECGEEVGDTFAAGLDPPVRRRRVVGERDGIESEPFGSGREPRRLVTAR